jgi:hypothetical protein
VESERWNPAGWSMRKKVAVAIMAGVTAVLTAGARQSRKTGHYLARHITWCALIRRQDPTPDQSALLLSFDYYVNQLTIMALEYKNTSALLK